MTTLAANKPRAYELGRTNSLPVIVRHHLRGRRRRHGGQHRPLPALAAGNLFVGFAERKADNSAGAAAPSTST